MQPALVVFDLDGTLIDSAPDMHRAVNLMLADMGCPPLSLPEIRTMVGDGASALIARALAARQCVTADPTTALAQFLEHYEANPTACTPTFPGVPETLERLQAFGLTLAICTNKPTRLTHMILERLGINRFFVRVIAGDTLPFRKPDPRALIEVLNVFGTPPGGGPHGRRQRGRRGNRARRERPLHPHDLRLSPRPDRRNIQHRHPGPLRRARYPATRLTPTSSRPPRSSAPDLNAAAAAAARVVSTTRAKWPPARYGGRKTSDRSEMTLP